VIIRRRLLRNMGGPLCVASSEREEVTWPQNLLPKQNQLGTPARANRCVRIQLLFCCFGLHPHSLAVGELHGELFLSSFSGLDWFRDLSQYMSSWRHATHPWRTGTTPVLLPVHQTGCLFAQRKRALVHSVDHKQSSTVRGYASRQ